MSDKKNILLSGAAVLLLAATACTQNELSSPSGGVEGALPEGEYPLIINATGLQAVATPAYTRATVDGNWDGVTSVALSVGGMVKEYSVTTTDTEKKTATLSRENDPFWWTSREDITVSAWWPCKDDGDNLLTTMPSVVVKQDQSTQKAFAASDFIAAIDKTVQFGNPTLEFSHRTARVTINLKPGTGITSVDGATVSLKRKSDCHQDLQRKQKQLRGTDRTADRCGRRAFHPSGLERRHLLFPSAE